MFKVLRKKSSPDKSASLARNSSLRSSSKGASNDTSTDPILDDILKIKFQSFQHMLGTLEKHGDIVPLKEYKDLYEDIQKSELSATNKNLLLFKICEDKADIAWQKREFSTHAQSLKDMFSIDVPSALIALEHWYVEYVKYEKQNINEEAKGCIKNIRKLYTESISAIKTEVNSLLQDKKYDEAVKKLEYLTEHSKSFHISAIHAQIFIKQGDHLKAAEKTSAAKECYENAYQHCKSKLSIDKDVPYDVIHDTFKVLEGKLTVVGNTELAAEAATYASKYKPNPVKILIEQGDNLAAAGNTSEAKKCYENAYQDCKSKLSKDKDVPYDVIHDTFKVLEDKLSIVGDTKLAGKAARDASKYKPDTIVATASVVPAVRKAAQEVEKLKEKYEEATLKLKTVITVDVHTKQLEELKAKYEAELEKLRTEHTAELEALKPKDSPTKDTKVDEAGDFSPTSSLLPPYSTVDIHSHPYLQLAKNATTTPTAPTAPVVPPLDEEVKNELTKLANLIPSLNYYGVKYDAAKDKAQKLLNEAVKENPDVYKTIDDPKILVLLADTLLSLNKMGEARIVCKKALELDPNIWEATKDQIVLLNLAGVLLSSDQPKAEQIYKKAIDIRIFFEGKHGMCTIDNDSTTIVSKTVALDGYSTEEKDFLAKVCLSAPKVFQKAQALDCYPHTEVTKRQEIAEKLKQFAQQTPRPTLKCGHELYTLYSKISFVLKDDQTFSHNMKAEYNGCHPYCNAHSAPYPPTEFGTDALLGMCALNDC